MKKYDPKAVNPLSWQTPNGLFVSADTDLTPYWIVGTPRGQLAIQLRENRDRPAFASIQLRHEPYVIHGRHFGEGILNLGEKTPNDPRPFRGQSGIICHQRWRLRIKLVEQNGGLSSTILNVRWMDEYAIFTQFYGNWSLKFDCGEGWTSTLEMPGPNSYYHDYDVVPTLSQQPMGGLSLVK